MTKLINLRTGQRFRDLKSKRVYVVRSKEGAMVEVEDTRRLWAWPSEAKVEAL